MSKHPWILAFAVAASLVAAPPAEAQVDLGPQVLYNDDLADGTVGIGARASFGVPTVGLNVRADGNFFFPDCGPTVDCDFWEIVANVTYNVAPVSPASPYLGGGLAFQQLTGGGGDVDDTGFNILGGVELGGILPLNAFGELSYRIMDGFSNQFVLSAGVLF